MDISVEETIKVANDAVICSKHFGILIRMNVKNHAKF
jgi:hypothetical protein